jgi:hypothetical protein
MAKQPIGNVGALNANIITKEEAQQLTEQEIAEYRKVSDDWYLPKDQAVVELPPFVTGKSRKQYF